MRFIIFFLIMIITACNKADKVISKDEIVSFVGNPNNGYVLSANNSSSRCSVLYRPPQYSAFVDCKNEFNDFSKAQYDSAVQKYMDTYYFEIHIESNKPKELDHLQDTLYSELFINNKSILPDEIFEEPIMNMMNSRRYLVFFPKDSSNSNVISNSTTLRLKLGDNAFEFNLAETLNLKFPMILNRS